MSSVAGTNPMDDWDTLLQFLSIAVDTAELNYLSWKTNWPI